MKFLFISKRALSLSVIYEIAPEKIKESYTASLMSFQWFLNFTSTKYLPLFFDVFEFHGSMYIFASVCILSALYILLCMPETKGKKSIFLSLIECFDVSNKNALDIFYKQVKAMKKLWNL